MNETVKQAMEMMEDEYKDAKMGNYLPDVNIGEIVEINDIWDGEGDVPEDSYSYKITDCDWINYSFELVEEKENPLDTLVRITNINLL